MYVRFLRWAMIFMSDLDPDFLGLTKIRCEGLAFKKWIIFCAEFETYVVKISSGF